MVQCRSFRSLFAIAIRDQRRYHLPNRSDHCRWSLDLRYQTTGHHTGRAAHPDFVVRSSSNPATVMADYEEWCRRWVDAFANPKGVAAHRAE